MRAGFVVSRLGVAMVVSVALVLGFVTPSYAEPLEPVEAAWDVEDLPPVPSPEVELPDSTVPEGSFDPPAVVEEVPEPTAAPDGATLDLDLDSWEVVDRDEFTTTYEVWSLTRFSGHFE